MIYEKTISKTKFKDNYMGRKLTQEEFIEMAKRTHDDKYDYSLVEYKNNRTKVKIIHTVCNKVFETLAGNFIGSKTNCPHCRYKEFSKKRTLTTEQFIEKAKQVHGDKYDYRLVEYKNSQTKVKIICKEHGVFEQSPDAHINQKQGCPKCIGRSLTFEEIIEKANKIHNNKYDYRLVEYKNQLTKVKIICKEHGVFEQTFDAHINQKQGCPKCKRSKGEEKIEKILIENSIKFMTQKKFKDCVNKRSLPFDFYLPEHNICIEFQGKQHYKKIPYFESKEYGFWYRKQNDDIKKRYCLKNNIILLEIKYNDNIKKKLYEKGVL